MCIDNGLRALRTRPLFGQICQFISKTKGLENITLVRERTDIFAKESMEKARKSCFVFNGNARQFDKTVTLETQEIMKLTDRR